MAKLDDATYDGEVWKHTMPGQPPEAANTRGARWNPPGVSAIYVALSKGVALAEGQHLASLQPQPLRSGRRVHHGNVVLRRVLDLRDPAILAALSVTAAELETSDFTACQRVGGTAAWLGVEAVIVPSARAHGANLVIFEQQLPPDNEIEFLDSEPVSEE